MNRYKHFEAYILNFKQLRMSDSIRVVCRLRPLNKIQMANQGQQCVSYTDKQITIAVGGEQTKHSFSFDKIFGPNTQQIAIYKQVSNPIIKSVLSGFNGTIFAYGQTGGGKTWTMQGPNHHDPQFKGLIPRTIQGLFQSIAESDQSIQFVIKGSYVQIYNQKLFDLLDPSKARLQIKEDKQRGVFIQNCTQISVSSAEQMLKTMDSGSQNRKVAFTGMNERSSRSHSLFIIHLYQKNVKKDNTKQSKLYFVDLAGSEKVSKTNVMGQQLQEAKNINKSLSALGNVINALTSDKKQHVPYRDSKLTRILQQSLGGNSRTTLIINCSMCTYNDKQTLSTLRFGYRAKSIKNKPKVNEEKSVKELLLMLEVANKTINELRSQLKMPIDPILIEKQDEDPRDVQISELKAEIQSNKKQDEQRIKELQTRIKQLLLELSKQKEDKNIYQSKWSTIFMRMHSLILKINKYIRRSYVDLEFCLNDIILHPKNQEITFSSNTSKETVENTLKNIQQFQQFYKDQVEPIFKQIIKQQEEEQDEIFKAQLLTPDKRKTKIALSQPVLYENTEYKQESQSSKNLIKQDSMTNMSCIVQNSLNPSQENGSDKISQSQCSQIQTILESLQTKQSHRFAVEEMAASIKELKKENEQLGKKIQIMIQQRESFATSLQQQYEERLLELQERVHQYKSIMNQKDIQLTKYFTDIEKMKKASMEQKVVAERLKKIIDTSSNMKSVHDMEEKMRSLANQRQKIFNEMYLLREQLDEAEITIKQKDEHIDSLKSVMRQLNENSAALLIPSQQQIAKNYKNQVFGTDTPNVVQIVKGGGNKQAKKSSLRKKTMGPNQVSETNMNESQKKQLKGQQGVKQYLPFFKSFFN